MRFLVGLIGSNIAASGSPAIHEEEARALGHHLLYQLVDLHPQGLSAASLPHLLEAAELLGFAGLNITHPCKQAVIPHLHELSGHAAAVGAVNTVVFRNGRRIGHNTDWLGFYAAYEQGLPDARRDSVLLLGAGGGGSAICYAALQLGIRRLFVFDQNQGRAEALARQFGDGRVSAVSDPLPALRSVSGLIHATPTGMTGQPGIAIPPEYLRPDLWVADIVYFPLETQLLREARQHGCRTLDGGGMAVFQAAEAFRLFTGLEPDTERMLARFRETYRG
ncbi:MAG: shikimate dehydrogenase [Acidobacteria bacterium]|nr:shikimate dehydrogenase [Acidobacteriota bacterium]